MYLSIELLEALSTLLIDVSQPLLQVHCLLVRSFVLSERTFGILQRVLLLPL
jgi:hypothetical protein